MPCTVWRGAGGLTESLGSDLEAEHGDQDITPGVRALINCGSVRLPVALQHCQDERRETETRADICEGRGLTLLHCSLH